MPSRKRLKIGGIFTHYPIEEQLLSYNRPGTSLQPEGYVIHATDTSGATAQNEHDYFNSGDRQASAHYFVDWTTIIRTIPENEMAWHAGPTANRKYLSVEMCEPAGYDAVKFLEVWQRTVWLVAAACVRHGWVVREHVFSHADISNMYHETNHTDPIGYLSAYGRAWNDLLTAIAQEVEILAGGKKMKNLILVKSGPDERAAGYLADFLCAPVAYMDAVDPADIQAAEKLYVVGGSNKPTPGTVLLSGPDRYATCQAVLDFIHSGHA